MMTAKSVMVCVFWIGIIGFGCMVVMYVWVAYLFLRSRYVRAKCGHLTRLYPENGVYVQRTKLISHGADVVMLLDEDGNLELCRSCIRKRFSR
jgi:hypothetical protein